MEPLHGKRCTLLQHSHCLAQTHLQEVPTSWQELAVFIIATIPDNISITPAPPS